MELLDLRYFAEAARCGNFTKAAERLFVTQPTLSRRIARFEQELGVKLFVRESQSVRLTPEGSALLPRAIQIIELCDSIPGAASDPDAQGGDSLAGVLRVGHQEFIDDSIMTRAAQALRTEYPQVSIEPTTGRAPDLSRSLSAGHIDAAFIIANALIESSGYRFHKVRAGEMELLVAPGTPLDGRDSIDISELCGARFVMLDRKLAPVYYDFASTQCINHGFTLEAACTVESMVEVVLSVEAGRGVGLIYSHSTLLPEAKRRGLRTLHITGADLAYYYGVLMRKDEDFPLLHAFLSKADEVAAGESGKEGADSNR